MIIMFPGCGVDSLTDRQKESNHLPFVRAFLQQSKVATCQSSPIDPRGLTSNQKPETSNNTNNNNNQQQKQ